MKNYTVSFNGLTINNYWDLSHEPYSVISVDEDASPALLFNELVIPNKDGAERVPDRYDNRDIRIQVEVRAHGGHDVNHNARLLARAWASGSGQLVLGKHGDKYYEGRVFDGIAKDELANGTYILTFTFNVQPFLYEPVPISNWGTITSSAGKTLNVPGDYHAYPTFTFEGSADTLTVSIGGSSFTYRELSGETLVVDCARMIAYAVVGGAYENRLLQFEGDFLTIPTGTSQLYISGSGLNVNAKMSTRYRHRF